MAFPTVVARASGRDAGNVTSHPITLPAGIVADELLLVIFSCDASETPTESSGLWTRLAYQAYSTTVTGAIFYKVATGGDTLTITTTTEEASHISFRISGAGTPTCTAATGSSTNSNPPNHANPGGVQDVLWIATRSGDAQIVATATPASFSNLQTLAAATTGGASSNTAERLLNASSLDPGVFTSATEQWVSYTIAVPPAPAAVVEGQASGAGIGLASSTAILNILALGTGAGIGLASSLSLLNILAQAQASGVGSGLAIGDAFSPFVIVEGNASGSGMGVASSTAILDILATTPGNGLGTGVIVAAMVIIQGGTQGSGEGQGYANGFLIVFSFPSGSGEGAGEAGALIIVLSGANGSGIGTGIATGMIVGGANLARDAVIFSELIGGGYI